MEKIKPDVIHINSLSHGGAVIRAYYQGKEIYAACRPTEDEARARAKEVIGEEFDKPSSSTVAVAGSAL